MSKELFTRNAWEWKCGLMESDPHSIVTLDELQKTEWSNEFELLMRNRLCMGALRYGRIGANGKPKYNRIDSIIKRMNKFRETGNKEYLVDAANLCLLEFVECDHPNAHFDAIDDGEHVSRS